MVGVRRVVAGLAGCVLVVSGLVVPSGVVVAAVPDPVVSVEPTVEVQTGSDVQDAETGDDVTEPVEDATKPAPEAKTSAEEGKSDDTPAGQGEPSGKGKSDKTKSGKGKSTGEKGLSKPSAGDVEVAGEDEVAGGDGSSGAASSAAGEGDGSGVGESSGEGSAGGEPVGGVGPVAGVRPAAGVVAAAAGPLTSISATVSEDGSAASFTAWGPVLAGDGSVLDAGPNNGVVAANDSVLYRVTAQQSSTPGTQTLVAVLPQGMEWDVAAAASNAGRCDVSAARSNGDRTLMCSWTNDGTAPAYTISALAWVWSVANGATVAPTFYDTNTSGASFPGPSVTVVAEPRTELMMYVSGANMNVLFGGVLGVTSPVSVYQGVTSAAQDLRGLEALKDPFTYVVDVPDGAVVYSATVSAGGGSVSTSQPGGPGADVNVTVTGTRTDFKNPSTTNGLPTDYWSASVQRLVFFVPNDPWIPPNMTTYLRGEVKGFDPDGLGGASNFGAGVAPGQDGLPACPVSGAATSMQRHCIGVPVTRTTSTQLVPTSVSVMGNTPSTFLFGDRHGYVENQEKVVPGQSVSATVGVLNEQTAGADVAGLFGCAVWDVTQLRLSGPVVPVTVTNTAVSAFYAGGGVVLGSSSYVLEYASLGLVDDAARKAFACGLAGDGDPLWSAAPPANADAVRVRFVDDAEPGRAFGLRLPLARTAMAFPVNTPLPWFWQYGWNADPSTTVLSNYNPGTAASPGGASTRGGNVQAVPALVRADTSVSAASAANGGVVGVSVSPFVIGPVAGPDTVALNTKVTVTMSSTCVSPVADSLPANATLTPADYGPDGVPCTGDDVSPAQIVFDLGDVVAVSGPVNSVFHSSSGGHGVALPPISFQVMVAPGAPDQLTMTATTVISSDSDTSIELGNLPNSTTVNLQTDRTSSASLAIAASEAFRGFKVASSQVSGRVAPGEVFSYTVGFANTLKGGFLPGVFVDVLPFPGDPRLVAGETDGLAGRGESLTLLGVEAEMLTPSMGGVGIEYSTADPASAYATLAAAPDGSDAVFGWQSWPPADLAEVTALRFVTSEGLQPGFGGSATIRLRAGAVSLGGVVRNDVFGVALADPASVPLMSDQVFTGSIRQVLTSSAAEFAGTVQRDTDFDSATSDTVDASNDSWWPAGGVVELVEAGVVRYTAPITAGGGFDVGIVAAGTYVVRVQGASGWAALAGGTVTVGAGAQVTGHRLVVQEQVPDPVLVADTARTGVGGTVTIDVTANDTLSAPTASTIPGAQIVLGGSGTTGNGGAYSVSATPGSVFPGQPQVSFTASSTWPAAESGLSYTESFTYSWTNVLGVTESATVSVTVQKPPSASGGSATIGVGWSRSFMVYPQTAGSIASASVTSAPSQGTATVGAAGGWVSFNAGTADPGTYSFTVTWTDDLGQTGTSSYSVTVQAEPTATGGTATVPVGGSHTFAADPQTTGSIASATVTTSPAQGTATVDHTTGEVSFDATGADPGTYSFTVTWTDDLGQTGTSTYSVTVQAAPTATGGTAKVPVGGSTSFNADPQTTGSIASATVTSAPAQGTATVNASTGQVSFEGTGAAPGTYTFTVTWTDDLGQTGTSTYAVTVQAAPTATGGSATIPVGGSASFNANPQTTGSIASATVTSAPSQGTASVNAATGVVSFGATGAAPGSYSFTVTWTDDLGQTGTSSYSVTVQAGPTATGGSATVPVGGSHAFDADPQPAGSVVSASVTSGPGQGTATVNASTGEVSFDATGAAPGTYSFTVTWTDALGQTGTSSYAVTVQAAPSATGGTATIPVGGSASFNAAPQTTGSIASATVTSAPGQGTATVNASTGQVSFDATGADPGTYTFTVTWVDDLGQTGTSSYSVTVQAAPTATGGTATVPVGGSASFNADPQTTGSIASATVTSAPSQGTASVNAATGVVSFSATGAAPGTYTFVVTWVDDAGQTCTSTYVVTVQAPPTATGGTATIGVGGSTSFNANPQTTGSIASASVTSSPAQGAASVNASTGQVSFDATGADPGTYSFTVTWTDDLGQTGTSTYTVTVQAGPVVSGETSAVIPVDGSHLFTLNVSPGVTSASVTRVPACDTGTATGSVTSSATGEVRFVGAGVPAGAVCTFEVTFVDGHGQTAVVGFRVVVQAPPTATGGTATIGVDQSVWFNANPETTGSVASASVTSAPGQGTAAVNPTTGEVMFDGTGAEPGSYEFTVTWTDDLGQTGTSAYGVTVQAPPTAEGGTVTVPVNGSHVFAAVPQTTGSVVSASVTSVPSQGTASVDPATGQVSYDGTGAAPGMYTFTVSWVDDLGQTGTSSYTVTVRELVVTGVTTSRVRVGESHAHVPVVNHPAHVVSMVVTAPPGQGVVRVDPSTGEVRYDATGVVPGVYSYEITWTDDLGQTATLLHTVTVHDATECPVDDPDCDRCPPGEHCDDPTPDPTPGRTPDPVTGSRVGTGGSVTGGPGAGVVGLVVAGIAGLFAAALGLGNRRRRSDAGR